MVLIFIPYMDVVVYFKKAVNNSTLSTRVYADNPAVSAINQIVEALIGGQALLEVYVSGYPLVTGDHISWYWPNGSIIQEQDASFMNDGRTLFLVSVQLADAGAYRCEVILPDNGGNRSAVVQLNVHSEDCRLSCICCIICMYLVFQDLTTT